MSDIIGPTGFDYAKAFTSQALDLVITHLESIHNKIPDLVLLNLIIDLSVMSELIKKSKSAIFTKKDVDQIINRTLTFLIRWNPILTKQLELFLNAHLEIGEISSKNPNLLPYAPLKYAELDFDRLKDAHNGFVDLIKNFNTPTITIPQLQAILLAFIGKMETVGYAFEKQFFELLQTFGLQNNYDIVEIFLINKKIKRNTIYETDSLAIRDSITHYKYKITKTSNLWQIEFDNNEKGWSFNEKYSYEEFINFLDNNHKLYISQLVILMTIAANSFLKRYMIK